MLQAPDAFAARVRVAAGQRGPLGTRPGPVAARQDADRARPGRPGRGGASGAGARRVPGARRTVRDFVRPVRAGGPDRHARRVRRCVRALRTGDRGRHRGRCHRGCHPDADRDRPSCTGCYGDQDASAAAIAEAERCAEAGHLAGRAGRAGAGQGGARSLGRPRRGGPPPTRRRDQPCWATTRSRRTSAR